MPKGLIEQLVRMRTTQHPDSIWLKFKDESFQWKQVLSNIQRIANKLLEYDVKPGDKAAIMMRNKPEFIFSHFAMTFVGVRPVPINIAQRGEALSYILSDSEASTLIIDSNLLDVVINLIEKNELLERVFVFGPFSQKNKKLIPFENLLDGEDKDPSLELPEPPSPVGMLYTSGTTGPPKGVISDKADASGFGPVLNALGVMPGETIYTALPLFHGNALFISTIGSIVLDAKLALGERFSASRFFDEVRKFDAVEFNTLGGMISILLAQPPSSKDKEHHVRTVLSAGCPPDKWREFETRFNVRLIEFYGMVDAPGVLLNDVGKVGSMGKPVGGCEFKVVDENDNPLGPNQIGELVFRTPSGSMTKYHKNEAATQNAWRGGWFHTGDLALYDEEGFFYYKGRKKEAIRRLGENISSWEIETAANAHPKVLESAAYGVPSELGEEEVKLDIVLKDNEQASEEEIYLFLQDRLAKYAWPRYIEFVNSLPKTATERVKYQELKNQVITKNVWDAKKSVRT